MQDYELSILEQYPINVKSTRKTRGAFFCDTDQGLFLLREAGVSRRHALLMRHVGLHLYREGSMRTDLPVANCEGDLLSTSPEGRTYILKQWFRGRECDIRKSRELLEGTANLAHLHRFMRQVPPCPEAEEDGSPGEPEGLKKEYDRHNRELKKIRRFMRAQSPKGEFELEFLRCFEGMFEWALGASGELERLDFGKIWKDSVQNNTMIHGDYNYHNIFVMAGGYATTNFDRCRVGIQMEDLYYFLRKAMEKHGWNVKTGNHMLDAYSAIRPLAEAEVEYLKVRLIYPEKFWKLADSYYCSNKAWIPAKNVEKLKTVVAQTEEKRRFLKQLFSFSL